MVQKLIEYAYKDRKGGENINKYKHNIGRRLVGWTLQSVSPWGIAIPHSEIYVGHCPGTVLVHWPLFKLDGSEWQIDN